MELKIINYSGENIILFKSHKEYNVPYIKESISCCIDALQEISKLQIKDITSNNSIEQKIDSLLIKIKNAVHPELEYLDFLLVDESTYLNNLRHMPKFLYILAICEIQSAKVTICVDKINLQKKYSSIIDQPQIVTTNTLYLGCDSGFTCDNLDETGHNICANKVGEFSKLIKSKYSNSVNYGNDQVLSEGQVRNNVYMHHYINMNPLNYNKTDDISESYKMGFTSGSDKTFNNWMWVVLVVFIIIFGVIIVGIIISYMYQYKVDKTNNAMIASAEKRAEVLAENVQPQYI